MTKCVENLFGRVVLPAPLKIGEVAACLCNDEKDTVGVEGRTQNKRGGGDGILSWEDERGQDLYTDTGFALARYLQSASLVKQKRKQNIRTNLQWVRRRVSRLQNVRSYCS